MMKNKAIITQISHAENTNPDDVDVSTFFSIISGSTTSNRRDDIDKSVFIIIIPFMCFQYILQIYIKVLNINNSI